MIEIRNLNKTYDRGSQNANQVLHDITLTLPDTGFVCILGPSGCGKTSLLNAIGGLDRFDSGSLATGDVVAKKYGSPLFEAERNRSFGYIFQNYYLLPDHSVGYNVYLGLHSLDLSHGEKIRRVREALTAVEMDRYIYRNVSDLSGGQQQRVAIARALARKPRVIFADEPTGNLDEANTRNICSLLRRISRTSLVVMVTHEEQIARFFADRIITLAEGRVSGDSESWQRGSLSDSRSLYTADFVDTKVEDKQVSLRILQQEGCAPVALTLVVLEDRIVLKLDDNRVLTTAKADEAPFITEGSRPELTLEDVDREEDAISWESGETAAVQAGQGIRFRDMLREALHMNRGKNVRNLGTKLFLLVLTVLSCISLGDFLALRAIEPEDFIQTHSCVLEVSLERGKNAAVTTVGIDPLAAEFKSYLSDAPVDYIYQPRITYPATVSGSPILQTSELQVELTGFSYVPMEMMDESTLIMGRLPQRGDEVVVDRWVLDAALARPGVAQNGITGIEYFLGKTMNYQESSFQPVIVGICDSGEAAVYGFDPMFAALGLRGMPVATLSEFQQTHPGSYDTVRLTEDMCIVLPHNAGSTYRDKIMANYTTNTGRKYQIVMSSEETDFYAKIIVADDQLDDILLDMSNEHFYIFTTDKEAMTAYLQQIPEMMDNRVSVTVTDRYSDQMRAYTEASTLRADARTIVTATIMLLSVVMLYLLRRSQVQARIGMLSVYRLLGVPNRKTMGIFALESLVGSLMTALPAAVGTYLVLELLPYLPVSAPNMLLSFPAALGVYVAILAVHLAVSILPLQSLLKLPPAQLAAKFDF